MGYGSPRTLSEANMRNCKGDIQEFKPSLLVGIPAVYETVKKGVIANIEKGGPFLRTLFWSAFYAKKYVSLLFQRNYRLIRIDFSCKITSPARASWTPWCSIK